MRTRRIVWGIASCLLAAAVLPLVFGLRWSCGPDAALRTPVAPGAPVPDAPAIAPLDYLPLRPWASWLLEEVGDPQDARTLTLTPAGALAVLEIPRGGGALLLTLDEHEGALRLLALSLNGANHRTSEMALEPPAILGEARQQLDGVPRVAPLRTAAQLTLMAGPLRTDLDVSAEGTLTSTWRAAEDEDEAWLSLSLELSATANVAGAPLARDLDADIEVCLRRGVGVVGLRSGDDEWRAVSPAR